MMGGTSRSNISRSRAPPDFTISSCAVNPGEAGRASGRHGQAVLGHGAGREKTVDLLARKATLLQNVDRVSAEHRCGLLDRRGATVHPQRTACHGHVPGAGMLDMLNDAEGPDLSLRGG